MVTHHYVRSRYRPTNSTNSAITTTPIKLLHQNATLFDFMLKELNDANYILDSYTQNEKIKC